MNNSILVVDDSPNLHKLVRTYLEGEPLSIHSAYNGTEAMEVAVTLKPDLILLDVDMPDLNGFEVCRWLKTNAVTNSLPIIFLTADTSPCNQVKGLDLGATDYMTKRFKPEELRARIKASLRAKPVLDDAAMVDGITKLWNRAYLERHLPGQLSFAQRTHRPLCCIVGDIDRLRSINRSHGEHIGDDVLRSVAHIIASHGRTEDMVCYLQNGKFSMILCGADQAGGAQLADRMRTEVERQLKALNEIPLNVTCSFGVADTRTGNDESLLDRADSALYSAKGSGRNCVALSHPLAVTGTAIN
jgi:diguanylate cyclase (GGDEF)-like protein